MDAVRYEWDEAKRKRNLAKHGVDFAAIERFDWTASTAGPDQRLAYGETRILAYGFLDGRLHAVVYAQRGQSRRIISLRKANRREQKAFNAAFRGR
jgi:uncharacterized DUF497 family protein